LKLLIACGGISLGARKMPGNTNQKEDRDMAKLDESEGKVLSREEMKSTKGGLNAAVGTSEALEKERFTPPDAPKTIITERSLQEESIATGGQRFRKEEVKS
jgi:hypothetical protein